MFATSRRLLATALLAALVSLGGAACSGSANVPRDQVGQQISDQLNQQIGQRPDSVTCPEDLPAKVGASVRCTLKAGTDTLGVTATVTSVEGTNVKFNIQVDQTITPAPATPTS